MNQKTKIVKITSSFSIKGILKNYYFSKIIVVFQDICSVWGSTCKVIRDPLKIIIIALIALTIMFGCGKKQKGITVRLPFLDVPSFNPIYWQAQHILAQGTIYEGLFGYEPDSKGLGGVKLVKILADSYKVSPDGKRWIIKMVKDKKWSNGDPITAKDFEWSYRLYASTTFPDIPYWASPIQYLENAWAVKSGSMDPKHLGVKALDDYTLEFKCPKPQYNLHTWLAVGGAVPIHRATYEKDTENWWKPENFVGNGPYVVEDWINGEKTVLVKNTNYVGKCGNVERIILKVVQPGPGLSIQAYKTRELDLVFIASVGDLRYVQKDTELTEQCHEDIADLHWAGYQIARGYDPIFDDIRIRKAFALAVDRTPLVEKVLGKRAIPGYRYWHKDTVLGKKLKGIEFNIEKAKKLLADAGYPEGKGLPQLRFYTVSYPAQLRFAEYIVDQWKKNLGVNVLVQNVEAGLYSSKYQWGDGPDIDAGFVGMGGPMNSFSSEGLLKNSCHSYWFYDYPAEIRAKRYELTITKRQDILKAEGGTTQEEWDKLIAKKKQLHAKLKEIIAKESDKYMKEDWTRKPVWHENFDLVVEKYKNAKDDKEKNGIWKEAALILLDQELFQIEWLGMNESNRQGRRMHNKLGRTAFEKASKTCSKNIQHTLDLYYMVPMYFDKIQYLLNPKLKGVVLYKFSWGPLLTFNYKYLEYDAD